MSAQTSIDYSSGNPELGSVNINDLREAFALQRFEEHRSMFGSRYEDLLRYLGVRPQDARLQLPEYLGGFSAPVQFSEVLQTSSDAERSGVGDMYGHGMRNERPSHSSFYT
ncbi:MAG: major capsid protein [Bilophila wadsworthia]